MLNALYIYGILTLLLRNYCYNILHLLHFIISLLGFHLKFTASVLFASLKQIIFCSSNSVVFSKYYCHNTCPKILQYYLSFLILLLKYILSTFSPGLFFELCGNRGDTRKWLLWYIYQRKRRSTPFLTTMRMALAGWKSS